MEGLRPLTVVEKNDLERVIADLYDVIHAQNQAIFYLLILFRSSSDAGQAQRATLLGSLKRNGSQGQSALRSLQQGRVSS